MKRVILQLIAIFCISTLSLKAESDIEIINVTHDSSVGLGDQVNITGWIINHGPGSINIDGLNVHVALTQPSVDENLSVNFHIGITPTTIEVGDSIYFDELFDASSQNGFAVAPSDIVIVWPTSIQSNDDPNIENNFYQGEIEILEPNSIANFNSHDKILYFNGSEWNFDDSVESIKIFDLTGKEILSTHVNKSYQLQGLDTVSSIYILICIDKNGATLATQKLFIQ